VRPTAAPREEHANGRVIANDDASHRVIVVDPQINRVVWPQGETGKEGREPGRLDTADGVDLAAVSSVLVQHSRTMGTP